MGGILDVPCDGYTESLLRSAESFSCRFDVALRLFAVSEHQFLKKLYKVSED